MSVVQKVVEKVPGTDPCFDQLTGVSGGQTATLTYDLVGNRSMSGPSGITYAYDNEGNLTAKTDTGTGKVTTYSYDDRNRLEGVTQKNSGGGVIMQATFTYDALNRRIATEFDADGAGGNPPVKTWTVYDGLSTYADFNSGGTLLTRYLFAPGSDMLLARTSSGGTTGWYVTDKLGSVIDIVDTSGTGIYHATYNAFGNVASESNPSNGDRFKFAGMRRGPCRSIQEFLYGGVDAGRTEGMMMFAAGDCDLVITCGGARTAWV